jgi:hypothetical protein
MNAIYHALDCDGCGHPDHAVLDAGPADFAPGYTLQAAEYERQTRSPLQRAAARQCYACGRYGCHPGALVCWDCLRRGFNID